MANADHAPPSPDSAGRQQRQDEVAVSGHLQIARLSVRGSIILFSGQFLSTVVSAVALILIARLLGPAEYGVYSLALLVPNILQLFAGFGLIAAVTRYAAHYSSLGMRGVAVRYTRNAIIVMMATAVVMATVDFVAAPFLAGPLLLRRPDITGYVQLGSLIVVGSTLLNGTFAAALGWGAMGTGGLAYVVQAVTRLALSVGLLLAGLGILGALLGHIASFLVAGGVVTLALQTRVLGRRSRDARPHGAKPVDERSSERRRAMDEAAIGDRGGGGERLARDAMEMVRYGFPTYISAVLTGMSTYYVTLILAFIASNAAVGYYQAASNFALTMSLASGAIANALFPAFTSLHGIQGETPAAFRHSVKYVSFFLSPVLFFILLAAPQLVSVFYGASFSPSVGYLRLLAVSYAPILIGFSVAPSFFNGVGSTRLTFISSFLGALALGILAPLLGITMRLGLDGLIYAVMISNFVTAGFALFLAHRVLDATIDVGSIVLTVVVSALSLAAAYALSRLLVSSNLMTMAIDAVVFLVVYLTLLPLLRAISRPDIERLVSVIQGMGYVWVVMAPIVRYEIWLTKMRAPR
jgi:O-antigen/teichoic acid export membrane protein